MKAKTPDLGLGRAVMTAVATAALGLVTLGGCSGASEPGPSAGTAPASAGDAPPDPTAVGCAPPADDGVLAVSALSDACWATQLASVLPPSAVVCFGEPSHGLTEPGAVRAMLFDTLAAGAPITLAMELDDATAFDLSAYVRSGDEAPLKRALMAAKGTLGATKAMLEHFHELRDIVVRTGHVITVRGIDVDINNALSIAQLANVADGVAPDIAADVRALPVNVGTTEDAAAGAAAARALVPRFEAHRAAISPENFGLGSSRLRSLAAGYDFAVSYTDHRFFEGNAKTRDPFMAARLFELAQATNDVIVVEAHNGHCARAEVSEGSLAAPQTWPTMGERAAKTIGARFVSVAILASAGKELLPSGGTSDVLPTALAVRVAKHTDAAAAVLPVQGQVLGAVDLDTAQVTVQSIEVPAKQWGHILWIRQVTATRFLKVSDLP